MFKRVAQIKNLKKMGLFPGYGVDGKKRCFGSEIGRELYADYHDNEWGIPLHKESE